MSQDESAPKLHVDADWKAEAQAEKERLAAKEKAQAEAGTEGGGPEGRGLPEASFRTLVGTLASQAIMGLGAMVDPQTKGIVIDMEGARFAIDLLGVIEEKTKGNLDQDEENELRQVLAELRSRYVEVSHLVAQQAAAGNVTTAGGPVPPGATPRPDVLPNVEA
jgi:hypothetical protein